MKEFNTQESVSFGGALKIMKNTQNKSTKSSRIAKVSTDTVNKAQHYQGKKVNLIKRTEVSLNSIFAQYLQRPQNEYVMKLNYKLKESEHPQSFDQWIDSIEEINQNEKPLQNGGKQKEQLKAEIGRQMEQLCNKIQADHSFGKQFKQHSPQDQTKQQTNQFQETKFRQDNPYLSIADYQDDEVIQQATDSLQYSKKSLGIDKENQNPNSIVEPINLQVCQIIGLQFNHNKRFKTARRKRKVKQ